MVTISAVIATDIDEAALINEFESMSTEMLTE